MGKLWRWPNEPSAERPDQLRPQTRCPQPSRQEIYMLTRAVAMVMTHTRAMVIQQDPSVTASAKLTIQIRHPGDLTASC